MYAQITTCYILTEFGLMLFDCFLIENKNVIIYPSTSDFLNSTRLQLLKIKLREAISISLDSHNECYT